MLQDLIEFFGTLGGMVHKFLKDPLEVSVGICATAADLFNEGVNDGTAPAGVFAANKHPVLVSELGETDRILDTVVIEINVTMFKAHFEMRSLVVGDLTPKNRAVDKYSYCGYVSVLLSGSDAIGDSAILSPII